MPDKAKMKVKTTKSKKTSSSSNATPKSAKKSTKTPKTSKASKTTKTSKSGKTPKATAKGSKTPKTTKTPKTSKGTKKSAKDDTSKKVKSSTTRKVKKIKTSDAKTPKTKKTTKKVKKTKTPKAEAPPPIPQIDPAVERDELEKKLKKLTLELAKHKRITWRGEQDLEAVKRNFCIQKAKQSHINDAIMREHDELIEDMIDMLYEYEERIENYEVLNESFAENYEDSKADLGYDVELQRRAYTEQAQKLQEFAEEITEHKEKYTVDIDEARRHGKKLARENEGLQMLLGDVQKSLDGGEGIPQRLFEENTKLEKEVKELEALLKQAASSLKKPASVTKKEAAQAKAIAKLQSDNTRLMGEIGKLQTKKLEAFEKQQTAQAAAEAARGGAAVDEEHENAAKQMRAELKDLQKMMKDLDKKFAKTKMKRKKSEAVEYKALGAEGKKLTVTLKKIRSEKKALASQPKAEKEPPKEADPEVVAKLEAEVATLTEEVATAEAQAADLAKAAKAEANAAGGDGPSMEDMRACVAELKAGSAKVKETKAKILNIETELEEARNDKGNIDDKLKRIRKATREVRAELEKVEKEAKKHEARNQDALKKARKKYGGVGKVAKRVGDAFKKLSQSTRGLADDVRAIFDKNVPFITKKMTRLAELCEETGKEANKAIAKYNKEFMLRKGFHNKLQELRGNIRVFARCRPILPFEKKRGARVCVDFPMPDTLSVKDEKRNTTNTWEFDKVFKPGSFNMDVFKEIEPLVTSILDGYNVCIFAYGQTGAGKTYTMEGKGEDKGLNWRTLDTLFAMKEKRQKQFSITIAMSFLEIYNEEIKDLLNSKKKGGSKLKVKMLKGGGNEIPGLVTLPVNSVVDLDAYVEEGKKRRTCKKTKMNDSSSRSHAVLSIYCTCLNKMSKKKMKGKLHLIDLAGSERLDKSGATGQALKEAIHINKSLSALGDVIAARANKSGHCPYRNSALTHVLEDSLAGDSKTLMLSQISPATDNAQESACTLRFASRVRKVELGRARAHGKNMEEAGGHK